MNPGSIGILNPSRTYDPKMLLYLVFNPSIFSITEYNYQPADQSDNYSDRISADIRF
jgi:hypothetical protein